MRSCVTLTKFVAAFLLIIAPAVIGDGFKDYQLKFGYGIGEYRVIKWLNKIIRLDNRATDPQVSQFPPIKVHEEPFEVQHNPLIKNASLVPFIPSPANDPVEPITEIGQVPAANNSPPSHDSSSKSSSADSNTETPSVSALSHGYKDYLYMKWFHGSPNATYFNENPMPQDKLPSLIDNKLVQGPAAASPLKNTGSNNHNVFTNAQQPALLSFLGDSILSRMFNTVMRIAIPKFKKEDIGSLKVIDFPSQKLPSDQMYGSDQVFNNYLASDPLSKLDKPLAATTFNPLNLNYGLPIPVDIQPAEQSFNSQPQTVIISAAERNYVPLQTAYSRNKRPEIEDDNPSAQLELEPDNGALLLAFKPQVPTYA